MPLNTVIPIETRAAAPAPEAVKSGTTPRIKAIDVITIGRNRSWEAFNAASTKLRPAFLDSSATSTIKIAFLEASAIISTKPIWT